MGMWAKHVTLGLRLRTTGGAGRTAPSATARVPGSSHVTDKKMNPTDLAQEAIGPATVGGFSFLELFLQAHIVVKIVMVGLLLASIWSWAIIIEKLFAFRRARVEADRFEQHVLVGPVARRALHGAVARASTIAMAALFVAAMREWKRSVEGNIRALGGIQLRVEKVMDVTISREMERLDRRLLFLATVGSTAPFVGLFGTVWGIMTSFQAIAVSKNTNLAVVAPGIAEALFATALGLLAAIPAVIFYNKFAADSRADQPAAGGLRRRVLGHRLAPDRRQNLRTAHEAKREGAKGTMGASIRATPQAAAAAQPRAPSCADERDQRHADRRRDAGAADHLHGRGAAAARSACRSSCRRPRASSSNPTRSRWPSASRPTATSSSARPQVQLDEIAPKLKAIAKNGYDEQIFVRGDKGIAYGTVMRVMGRISAGGFRKVSLVTEVEDGG